MVLYLLHLQTHSSSWRGSTHRGEPAIRARFRPNLGNNSPCNTNASDDVVFNVEPLESAL